MPTISTLTVDVVSNTSKFGRGLRTATLGLGALAAGAAFAFRKFEESENVLQQTEAVLKSTGGAANVTAKEVAKLADTLAQKVGVDDEVMQAGENMLLTFKNIRNEVGENNDIFNQATTATLDMAAGMAAASGGTIDMKAASIQLGKALNDPVLGMTALTRVGVQFSEEQQKQIENLVKHNDLLGAQKIILAEVTSQFQGSAEAQQTASGTLKVAMENLAESVGAVLAPAIEKLVGWVTQAADWFTNLDKDTQELITTAGGLTIAVGILAKAFGFLLLPAIKGVIASFTLLAAHPIVAAMIAFGAIIAVVATKWDDLHGAIKLVLSVLSPFGVLIGLLIRAFGDIKEKVLAFAGVLKGAFIDAWNAVKGAATAALNGIIMGLNGVIRGANAAAEAIANIASGPLAPFVNVPDIPTVPHAASGGWVARSGMAVIHKGEMITPAGMGLGSGDIVLQINGATFARITRDELVKLGKRNVTSGI